MIRKFQEEEIKFLYLDENMSQREISKKLGISRDSIRYYLDKKEIKKEKSLILKSQKGTLFVKGHKKNLGREREDMVGNQYAKGFTEEKSSQWKGDEVGYGGVHQWLYDRFGKANRCEHNIDHKAKRFEWANISGGYLRKREDFIQLCPSCHRKFDAGVLEIEVGRSA